MSDVDPKSLKNLEKGKWKEGQSGNPNGRPKGSVNIKTLAKNILDDMDTWERVPENIKKFRNVVGNNKTFGEALIYAWIAKAINDPRFANIITELTDGKGKAEVDLGPGDIFTHKKLTIEIIDTKEEVDKDTQAE